MGRVQACGRNRDRHDRACPSPHPAPQPRSPRAQFAATIFPVLAPLPVARTASALAFFAFVRAFAQTWGITVASTVLQNELKRTLPAAFLARFPGGLEIAFAAIPLIGGLDEPLRSEVRAAFADSMRVIWLVMVGISGAGLLTVVLLKEVPMKDMTDERYALEERELAGDVESSDRTVAEREGTVEEKQHQGAVEGASVSSPGQQHSFVMEAEEGLHQVVLDPLNRLPVFHRQQYCRTALLFAISYGPFLVHGFYPV